jgi:chromosome segregation ATPase
MDESSLYSSHHVSEQKIGWSSSPLGHSYRTFEAEYRAKNIGTVGQSHGKRAAAQLASSRVIWFIERCRQLELECKQLRTSNEEKDKKLKRHDRDVSDLRKLINELCDKVRDLKKTTKAAKKEAETLRIDNVEVRAKLKNSVDELNRRKKSDDRLHGALVKSSRELQDVKLDLENAKQANDELEGKIQEMKKQSQQEVEAQRQDFQIRLDSSNKRAEDALQELKDKTGGWDEMKAKVETSEEREQATTDAANANIALMQNKIVAAEEHAKAAVLRAQQSKQERKNTQLQLDKTIGALESKQIELEETRRRLADLEQKYHEQDMKLHAANASVAEYKWKRREEGRKARIQHIKIVDRKYGGK